MKGLLHRFFMDIKALFPRSGFSIARKKAQPGTKRGV